MSSCNEVANIPIPPSEKTVVDNYSMFSDTSTWEEPDLYNPAEASYVLSLLIDESRNLEDSLNSYLYNLTQDSLFSDSTVNFLQAHWGELKLKATNFPNLWDSTDVNKIFFPDTTAESPEYTAFCTYRRTKLEFRVPRNIGEGFRRYYVEYCEPPPCHWDEVGIFTYLAQVIENYCARII